MIQPLADRVVVEPKKQEEVTSGGIVLPDNAKEKPMQGYVVAVGPGQREKDQVIPPEVQVGDLVLYSKYAGTEVKVGEKEYLIMRESDILAIVEKAPQHGKEKEMVQNG